MTRNVQFNRPEVQTKVTTSRRRTRAAALTSLAVSAILGVATADTAHARITRPPSSSSEPAPAGVGKLPTSVSVSCSPNPVVYPNTAQCTAIVGGEYTIPSGKVSWNDVGERLLPQRRVRARDRQVHRVLQARRR